MGASEKHKLSVTAAQALMWLNRDPKQIRPAKLRSLHAELRNDLEVVIKRLKEDQFGWVWAMGQRISHKMPRVPFIFMAGRDPMRPGIRMQWEPDILTLGYRDRMLHSFGTLVQEMWEKGPDRLKNCSWKTCGRFIWDPTTPKIKKHCTSLHDRERNIERERKARQAKKSRRK